MSHPGILGIQRIAARITSLAIHQAHPVLRFIYPQMPMRITGKTSIYLAFQWGMNDASNPFHHLKDRIVVRAIRVGPDK